MTSINTELSINPTQLLYNCAWEEILTCVGLVGRDKTDFLEDFYIALCSEIGARLCVEIGAHEAGGLQRLRKVLPEATLIAYEGNPYVYEKFASTVDKSIFYLNQIVSHDDKVKTLMIPRSMPSKDGQRRLSPENRTSSIRPRNSANVEYEEVAVASTSVDKIITDHPELTPATLWIDVEGAVGDVLFGAKEALKKDISVLYIELDKRQIWTGQWTDKDVDRYLNQYGFVPFARDMQTTWQYNQVYIRQDFLGHENVIGFFRRSLAALLRGEPLSK